MSTPVAQVRTINRDGYVYRALAFVCPGCEHVGDDGELYGGLHMLPVEPPHKSGSGAWWHWDGNLEAPTLSPSILTRMEHRRERVNGELKDVGLHVCHSFLRAGIWDFLGDCTHKFTGQQVPMKPLYDWAVKE